MNKVNNTKRISSYKNTLSEPLPDGLDINVSSSVEIKLLRSVYFFVKKI